jgi:putative peptidoglycan lipid II flippase
MQQSLILMLVTIVSKVFGLLREIALSYVYGTGKIADAFLVSFFIPSILINGINLGIATGFIPVYSKIKNTQGRSVADKFTNNVVNLTLILSTVFTVLALIFAREIMRLAAIGLEGEVFNQAVFFARMVMISIIFASVAGVYRGYLQTYKLFNVTVASSIIMNIVIIMSIIISGKTDYKTLGIGTGIGMSLQYLIFIPGLLSTGYRYDRVLDLKDKNLPIINRLAIPVLLGVLVNEVNIIVDKAIASTLEVGAISSLNYSSGVQEFVVGVVIISIITVRYTDMSTLAARGELERLQENYNYTLKNNLFLVIPATLGLMVFSKEIISLLFFRGAFDLSSLEITSRALLYYSLGITGIALNSIGQRVFYSLKQIREPVILSILSVFLNIGLNLWLSKIFGITGLAMGTSISMTITGLACVIWLGIKGIELSREILAMSLLKTIINSIIVISIVRFIYFLAPNNLMLIFCILLAVVSYIYLGIKTGIIEKEDVRGIFKKKIEKI